MRKRHWVLAPIFGLAATTAFSAGSSTPPELTVGAGLEIIANITLDEPAPPDGLQITLTSSDPERLKFSRAPEAAGTPELVLKVRGGYRGSPDFYVQGFGSRGKVTYAVTGPGLISATGTIMVAHSAVVFARSGVGLQNLLTTTGAAATEMTIYTALLDDGMNYLHPQPVAGGCSVIAKLASSDPKVGTLAPESVTIAGGSASATVEFRPLSAGQTALLIEGPETFSSPAEFGRTVVNVIIPGIGITDDVSVGHDLQLHGTVSLGEPAPAHGAVVTLASGDPAKLLISHSADAPGKDFISVAIPPGGVNASFYLQALSDSGSVTYTATAPGFRSRAAIVTLTPSGVVLGGPQGPPDEADFFSKEVADGPHGFVARIGANPPDPVAVYTVQLDPRTLRGADITVQAVRPGASLTVSMKNSNPSVGGPEQTDFTITAGHSSAITYFVPVSVGNTVISVTTPAGHITAGNSTALTVIVKK